MMKLRLASPKTLIDINNLSQLSYIREEEGAIAVGALTRHDQLANSILIQMKLPLIADAASVIADQQVRNRGTIGGTLAHADPNADMPVAVLASHGAVIAVSANGSRRVEGTGFFVDFFTTALSQNEIIREIRIPIPMPNSGGAYLKLSRGHNDFALVSAAAQIEIDRERNCKSASVALGGLASVPRHAKAAEETLMQRRIDDDLIERAAQRATEGLSPASDVHGSAEYKLKMAVALTGKVIKSSLNRALGGSHD
jgi:carbon-monoxide dehydrogenase medium subunit